MNDSPTCGVTKKVNMIEYMKQIGDCDSPEENCGSSQNES